MVFKKTVNLYTILYLRLGLLPEQRTTVQTLTSLQPHQSQGGHTIILIATDVSQKSYIFDLVCSKLGIYSIEIECFALVWTPGWGNVDESRLQILNIYLFDK